MKLLQQHLLLPGLAAAMLTSLPTAQTAPAAPPNLLIILADDFGYGDARCYNPQSKIPTPHLGRLAAEGLRFTDAHTPSAVCTPTRYALLTGRYAWRTRLREGVLDGFDPPLIEPGRLTLASLLRQHGYTTACVGKWHLGMQWTGTNGQPYPFRASFLGDFRSGEDVDFNRPVKGGPTERGFDWFYGIAGSLDMSPYGFIQNDRVVGRLEQWQTPDKSLHQNLRGGPRAADFQFDRVMTALTEKAVGFLREHPRRHLGKPFFLYVPLTAPHLPLVPAREFLGKSQAGVYGDFVAEVDATVGAVLRALSESGQADDTLVIFTSDNGGLYHWWDFREADDLAHGKLGGHGGYIKAFSHQGNGPLRGTKADIWEGGHRVPFIVRWPGRVAPNSTTDAMICLTDVMATVADLLNAALPRDAAEDSFSFLPALRGPGPGKPARTKLVMHSFQGTFAVREGDWKLVFGRGSGGFSAPVRLEPKPGEPQGQLYNLRTDLAETKNRYLEQPEIVARLTRAMEEIKQNGRSTTDPRP